MRELLLQRRATSQREAGEAHEPKLWQSYRLTLGLSGARSFAHPPECNVRLDDVRRLRRSTLGQRHGAATCAMLEQLTLPQDYLR